jgi:hypothetical protein
VSFTKETLLVVGIALAATLALLIVVERTRKRALPADLQSFWSEVDEYRKNVDAFKEWLREHGRTDA